MARTAPEVVQSFARDTQSRRYRRVLAAAFLALIAGIGSIGFFYLQRQLADSRLKAQQELSAIADLKVQQISRWREGRLGEAMFFSQASFVGRDVQALLRGPSSETAKAQLLHWMRLLKIGDRYHRLALFDPQGKRLLSVPEESEVPGPVLQAEIATSLRSSGLTVNDLHRGDRQGEINLDIVFPIHAPSSQSPIAVMVLEVNPRQFLFPLIQSWPMPSRTAETLLVRREGNDVVFLNELRHQTNIALSLRRPVNDPRLPAAMVARGETGVREGVDYRGVRVLAALRQVPDSPWFMVAKVDQEEIYAPVRERAWTVSIILIMLALGVTLATGLIWRQRDAEFLRRQVVTERERGAQAERVVHLMKSANDIILLTDEHWRIVEANDRATEAYGCSLAGLQQKAVVELCPPDQRADFRQSAERLQAEGRAVFETVHQRQDGSTFPIEISARLVQIGGATYNLVIGRDITERKRAEEEVRRNLERIQALREIDQAIASTLNLDAIFNVLLERIDTFLLYPAATMVRLFNQQTRELEFFTCRNLDKDEWKARDASSQGGRAKVVFETKEPLLIRNVQTDPRTWEPEFFRKHGLVSYLGVPLTAKGKPLGVLSLYTKQEHEFSKEEVDFLSTLAGQAAIAVQNSQLYEQTKKQTEELKKTIAELKTANQVKNQFLSVMSHELRTPLNVVLGYTGMLRDGMLGEIPPEQKKVLGKVINRAGDLLTLIRDILQATQIESRSVIVERRLVDLLNFLDKLRTGYDPTLDKEVNFVWDYPRDLPPVITDSEKLKQILQNLIHNAIKFTEKGSVTITARIKEGIRQRQFVEFKVADSGIGMPKELLPVIFEKFTQADSTETRLYGGVGLGLYIVKEFTELLGGTVQVESEPEKGSTFTVTLPLEQ